MHSLSAALKSAADKIEVRLDDVPAGDAGELLRDDLEELVLRIRHAERRLGRIRPPELPTAEQTLAVDSAEAARLLGISSRTLERLVKAGDLKPSRFGRARRFDRAELTRYLAEAADRNGALT